MEREGQDSNNAAEDFGGDNLDSQTEAITFQSADKKGLEGANHAANRTKKDGTPAIVYLPDFTRFRVE